MGRWRVPHRGGCLYFSAIENLMKPKSWLDEKLERWAIALTFGGIVLTFFVALITPPEIKGDIIFSATIGLLIFIIIKQHERLSYFGRIEDGVDELRKAHRQIIDFSKSHQLVAEKIVRILDLDERLHSTAFNTLRSALTSLLLDSTNKYMLIHGRDLSFAGYVHFWNMVLGLQKGSEKPFVARVTHASEIDTWQGHPSRALRDMKDIHADFVSNGGNVFRLFLADKNTGKLVSYVRAIRAMTGSKIHCAFIHRSFCSDDVGASDFTSDFCIIDSLEFSSDWKIDGDRRVWACEIGLRKEQFDTNCRRWQRYVGELCSYDYRNHRSLSERDRLKLEVTRLDFLRALGVSWNLPSYIAMAERELREAAD